MNFAYIAINVRNFNSKVDFRENATFEFINYYGHSGYELKIQIP
jgi:hypothetical protein